MAFKSFPGGEKSVIDFKALEASMVASKHAAVTTKVANAYPLNDDQLRVVDAMQAFVDAGPADENYFFVLEGQAGVGKTFCIKDLVNRLRGRMVFTAPTNKATKVLRESITTDGYKPECRTIYSLLGLRLEANGEIKELTTPEEPLDLTKFLAVVVDEGSMINKMLMRYIEQTAKDQNIQFIFMGDPAQLPPVGEIMSPIWRLENNHKLTKVMRHDNQILKLATAVRQKLSHPAPSFTPESDFDSDGGVKVFRNAEFVAAIKDAARQGEFSKPNRAKAIAWRNVTVDALNRIIRSELFDNANTWSEGDRIIMLEPAKDLEGDTIAHTDDEGTVTRVNVAWHPHHGEFKCYAISVTFDDNHAGTIWLLHEDSAAEFEREVQRRAAEARSNSRLWKTFWGFKEAFHKARYAYAITAHRSQGSTYETAFVDYRDIMLNRTRREAFQCLYVACTRPKRFLFLA